MIRLAINGAHGRMGARLCDLAHVDTRFNMVATLTRDTPHERATTSTDLLIDVSCDSGARAAVEFAHSAQSAVLFATTGLSDETLVAIDRLTKDVAVLVAPNTSIGVAVMKHLAVTTARLLGDVFDISLHETHHTQKRDAPSGTALAIAHEIEVEAGRKIFEKNLHSSRVGTVVGVHSLRFSGPDESLEITHKAESRDVFVRGALHAGAWLVDQPAGRYTIEQAIGM